MVAEVTVLVALVMVVDRSLMPTPARRRGRPKTCSDRLFLTALVIMVVRHLAKVHSFLSVLEEPETAPLRELLMEDGRHPARRAFEPRLRAMRKTLPAQITCLSCHLLVLIDPFRD